jgi:hypothetical protein
MKNGKKKRVESDFGCMSDDELQALNQTSCPPVAATLPTSDCTLTEILSAFDEGTYGEYDDAWIAFGGLGRDVDSGRYDDICDSEEDV